MTVPRLLLLVLVLVPLAGCGSAAPGAAPPAVSLTAEDRSVWTTPPDRGDRIRSALHGLGAPEDFASEADAAYGLDPDDFAKQMALLAHAGYEAVTLRQFRAFADGDDVALPDHPILITFDDSREDSWATPTPSSRSATGAP